MGLEQYTDQELRDELKRRSLLRKEQKEDFTRCESCKHCGTWLYKSFLIQTRKQDYCMPNQEEGSSKLPI